MKRLGFFCAAAAILIATSAPAMPPQGSPPPSSVSIAGVPETGSVLSPAVNIPTGSTCIWFRGVTQVSTSCVSYTVQAADAGANLTLQVTTANKAAFTALTISGTPSSTGTVGTAYSFTPGTSGGSGGNVFVQSGALPPGLSFTASTGALSGTPTTAGTYAGLGISVTDSVGGSASLSPFTITVASGGGGGSGALDFSNASNSYWLGVVR